ncbi:outer membrane protein assembly factor BamB family protein [Microlunatus parietis]|uniref:Outer membrane protein assembly factor BamB n=1 Tax=Microlunatus parietis TaxID=682979 RepID=A0A7Y9LCR4_9ACTN|nr:PQQ-binding-like beta-propeller repeat protein [Microlunatus parietis]NYE75119.1 outer membrane protein assembly factor BamB [Microlunatus parietis]
MTYAPASVAQRTRTGAIRRKGRLRRLCAIAAVTTAVLLTATIAPAGAAGPATPDTAMTLAPTWTSHFGDGKYRSSPVVSGDHVYIGDEDGRLTKLPLATGTEGDPGSFVPTWSSNDCGHQIQSSPVVAGSRVFVGTLAGYVCAFDDATGGLLWRQAVPHGGWVNGLAIVGDTLYATARGGAVVAFDAFSDRGNRRWAARAAEGDAEHPMLAGPLVLDGTIYVGTFDGRIVAVAPPVPGGTEPTVTEVRRFLGGRIDDTLASDGADLYFAVNYRVGQNIGMVRLVSLTTEGQVRWNRRAESDPLYNDRVPTPTTAGDRVYFPTHSSILVLDSATGRQTAVADTGAQKPTTPTVVNGVLYTGGLQIGGQAFGALQAFDAATGALLFYRRTPTVANTTPAVAPDGTVLLGGGNAGGGQGGGVVWAYAPSDAPQHR